MFHHWDDVIRVMCRVFFLTKLPKHFLCLSKGSVEILSAHSSTFAVFTSRLVENKTLMVFFQQWLSAWHSSIKIRFYTFLHLICGSLQLLQSHHRPLGFFSK
ncbi:hypothetical protein ILYODFUR_014015 [Ilyodon furcidens]|uniref:Uncharacterized protein n=1 Tax=Ilyodon furcidens TaxID=33524 RepID=A0ABV0VDT4_9TELE